MSEEYNFEPGVSRNNIILHFSVNCHFIDA